MEATAINAKHLHYLNEYVKMGPARNFRKLHLILKEQGFDVKSSYLQALSTKERWAEQAFKDDKARGEKELKKHQETLGEIKVGVESLLLKLVKKANEAVDANDMSICTKAISDIEKFCGEGNVLDSLMRGYQITQPKKSEVQVTNNTLNISWNDEEDATKEALTGNAKKVLDV